LRLRRCAPGFAGCRAADLRDPEVEDLDELSGVSVDDKDVVRLEIAVRDTELTFWARDAVGSMERPSDRAQDVHRGSDSERRQPLGEATHDHVLERLPVEPLEGDERDQATIGEPEGVDLKRAYDLGDGARESKHDLSLFEETREEVLPLVLGEARGDLEAF
jgi:hypothetical protein